MKPSRDRQATITINGHPDLVRQIARFFTEVLNLRRIVEVTNYPDFDPGQPVKIKLKGSRHANHL